MAYNLRHRRVPMSTISIADSSSSEEEEEEETKPPPPPEAASPPPSPPLPPLSLPPYFTDMINLLTEEAKRDDQAKVHTDRYRHKYRRLHRDVFMYLMGNQHMLPPEWERARSTMAAAHAASQDPMIIAFNRLEEHFHKAESELRARYSNLVAPQSHAVEKLLPDNLPAITQPDPITFSSRADYAAFMCQLGVTSPDHHDLQYVPPPVVRLQGPATSTPPVRRTTVPSFLVQPPTTITTTTPKRNFATFQNGTSGTALEVKLPPTKKPKKTQD